MKRLKLLPLGLLLSLGVTSGYAAPSSSELSALQKRLTELEKKTNRLEQENRKLLDSSIADRPASSADKIKLSGPIKELSLYGDLGLRYQWDNSQNTYYVNPKGEVVKENGEQRSRFRYRLRLNADFKLSDNWFGGVGLASNQYPDSGFNTYDGGFKNYEIYISKAYVGWKATDWATIIAGKQNNPFYRTELYWDNHVNPSGLTERIEFHKIFGGAVEEVVETSTDGKTVVTTSRTAVADSPWELSLVAGQFFFDDNNEYNLYKANARDAYVFQQQLIGTYKFTKNFSITLAPAYIAYTNAKAKPVNVAPFSSLNDGLPVSIGETRYLNILEIPGDISFKVFGQKTKLIWDFTYNFDGKKRTEQVYQLNGAPVEIKDKNGVVTGTLPGGRHQKKDDFAYLVGLQVGENKKKNDWSFFANYRQIGLAAVDPNLNEGTWGSSRTNLKGWKVGAAYNFTDSVVGSVTYMYADALRKNLYGGQASGGAKVASLNKSEILQVDLNVKF